MITICTLLAAQASPDFNLRPHGLEPSFCAGRPVGSPETSFSKTWLLNSSRRRVCSQASSSPISESVVEKYDEAKAQVMHMLHLIRAWDCPSSESRRDVAQFALVPGARTRQGGW